MTMKAMSTTWNTKYGSRRVRHDPPTLKEAITAAQGLSDQIQDQIEIAASLMDLPIEDVRAEVLKAAPSRTAERILAPANREGTSRSVIVERKVSRRTVRPTTGA
jgi:2-phospho-L-lactate guanylyltransferase (CobY/MobA/RfbA family)